MTDEEWATSFGNAESGGADAADAPLPPAEADVDLSPIQRVCVVGGGAMGSLLASKLSAVDGVDVTLLTRWEEHGQAIAARGLQRMSPSGALEHTASTVTIATSPAEVLAVRCSVSIRLFLIYAESMQSNPDAGCLNKASICVLSNENQHLLPLLSLSMTSHPFAGKRKHELFR
jgi:prephenate dehydrogenase